MERDKFDRNLLITGQIAGSAMVVVIGAGAIALNALEGTIGSLVFDSGATAVAAGFLADGVRKAIRSKIQNGDPRSGNRAK